MYESQKFRRSLLEILANLEGDWIALNDAMELARNASGVDLQYSTLKTTRQAMKYEGLVETQQGQDKHWELRITDKGMELAQAPEPPPKNGQKKVALPKPPFRIGKGHLLPGLTWQQISSQVKAGKLDLIVVPHDKPIGGAGYWDE
jgi:predicted transcriptional regulator